MLGKPALWTDLGRSVAYRLPPGPRAAPESGGRRAARLDRDAEDFREGTRGDRAHLVDRHVAAELARERRERVAVQPARRDPLRERRRVEVDVQRVAVRRHPLVDVDADRRDLPRRRFEPYAGEALDPRRGDTERAERPDQRLLEVAAVLLHVLPVTRQVE